MYLYTNAWESKHLCTYCKRFQTNCKASLVSRTCHYKDWFALVYSIAKNIMVWAKEFSGNFLAKAKLGDWFSGYTATDSGYVKGKKKNERT